MAFIEQNKRWLLPLLGLVAGGILWLNRPGRPSPPLPRPPSSAQGAGTDGTARAPEPEPPGADEPPAAEAGPVNPFQPLEAPAPAANDPAPLLVAGRQAIAPELRQPPRPPMLHPDQWRALPGAAVPPPPPPSPRAAAALTLPPRPEFLFENAAGRIAWLKGHGYRPGAVLEGGYTLKRISATGIVVSGPDGDHELPLNSPRDTRTAAPAQVRTSNEVQQ